MSVEKSSILPLSGTNKSLTMSTNRMEKFTLGGAIASEVIAVVSVVALAILLSPFSPVVPVILVVKTVIILSGIISTGLAISFLGAHIILKNRSPSEMKELREHLKEEESKYYEEIKKKTETIANLNKQLKERLEGSDSLQNLSQRLNTVDKENEQLKKENEKLKEEFTLLKNDLKIFENNRSENSSEKLKKFNELQEHFPFEKDYDSQEAYEVAKEEFRRICSEAFESVDKKGLLLEGELKASRLELEQSRTKNLEKIQGIENDYKSLVDKLQHELSNAIDEKMKKTLELQEAQGVIEQLQKNNKRLSGIVEISQRETRPIETSYDSFRTELAKKEKQIKYLKQMLANLQLSKEKGGVAVLYTNLLDMVKASGKIDITDYENANLKNEVQKWCEIVEEMESEEELLEEEIEGSEGEEESQEIKTDKQEV